MEINRRTASPQRSRSIKIKLPNKMFPEDFFRRSTSQSPQRYQSPQKFSPPLKKKVSMQTKKNELYWEIMREELQKCRPETKKQFVRPIQRIWVYSQKKCRDKVYREEAPRKLSKKVNQSSEVRENAHKVQIQEENNKNSCQYYLQDGLFTFYGKGSKKNMNIHLPSIK